MFYNKLQNYQKYMRRRRYRLVVAFESAGMMTKSYEDVEFEVSIGNVGNKFETKGGPPFVSCTDSVNTMSDGTFVVMQNKNNTFYTLKLKYLKKCFVYKIVTNKKIYYIRKNSLFCK